MAHGVILKDEATGLINSNLRNSNTATRNYTLQDRDGTIADLVDISTATIVSVTGAISLDATALGKLHSISGTSADYSIVLPTAVGNTGKAIAFKCVSGFTRFATLDGNATETIDGSLTQVMWSNESMTIISDGTNWVIASQLKRAMMAGLFASASQAIGSGLVTPVKVTVNTAFLNNTGLMSDTVNNQITIKRAGNYEAISYGAWVTPIGAIIPRAIYSFRKNTTAIDGYEAPVLNVNSLSGASVTRILEGLAAADVIDMTILQNSGGSASLFGSATFTQRPTQFLLREII